MASVTGAPAKRNLLLCFDAFGTLFVPRKPIAVQYAKVATTHLGRTFSPEEMIDLEKSFKYSMRTISSCSSSLSLILSDYSYLCPFIIAVDSLYAGEYQRTLYLGNVTVLLIHYRAAFHEQSALYPNYGKAVSSLPHFYDGTERVADTLLGRDEVLRLVGICEIIHTSSVAQYKVALIICP
jgi:hypothetical protein